MYNCGNSYNACWSVTRKCAIVSDSSRLPLASYSTYVTECFHQIQHVATRYIYVLSTGCYLLCLTVTF